MRVVQLAEFLALDIVLPMELISSHACQEGKKSKKTALGRPCCKPVVILYSITFFILL